MNPRRGYDASHDPPLAEQLARRGLTGRERDAVVARGRGRAGPAGLLDDAELVCAGRERLEAVVARAVAERVLLGRVPQAVAVGVDEDAPARETELAGVLESGAVGVVEDVAAEEDLLRDAEVLAGDDLAGRERDVEVAAGRRRNAPARAGRSADAIDAGGKVREAVRAGRVGRGFAFAGVEHAVLVRVDVEDLAGKGPFAAVADAVAVGVEEVDTGDRAAGRRGRRRRRRAGDRELSDVANVGALAVDGDVVRSRAARERDALAEGARVRAGDFRARAVVDDEAQVERGAGGDDVGIERDAAAARRELEQVDVGVLLDHALAAEARAGSCESGGGRAGAAVVVGAVAEPVRAVGEDRQVVLDRGGGGRGSAPPQPAGGVEARAHDRRDRRVALVVLGGAVAGGVIYRLVDQAEPVARLMRDRLGDGAAVAGEGLAERKGGVVGGVGERARERDAAAAGHTRPRAVAADHRLHRHPVGEVAGVDRRDVEVERRILLRDARPDLADGADLARAERVGVAVGVVRGGGGDVVRAPGLGGGAVEVEVQLGGRAGSAAQRGDAGDVDGDGHEPPGLERGEIEVVVPRVALRAHGFNAPAKVARPQRTAAGPKREARHEAHAHRRGHYDPSRAEDRTENYPSFVGPNLSERFFSGYVTDETDSTERA